MSARLTGPGAWILYLITAMLMVFILAPLAVVIAMSVSDSYFVSFPPQGFTLKWYAKILQDRDFLVALRLSSLLALSTTTRHAPPMFAPRAATPCGNDEPIPIAPTMSPSAKPRPSRNQPAKIFMPVG